MSNFIKIAFAVFTLASGLSVGAANAEWPEKPIKVIIPFGPGGAADVLTRNFQKVFKEEGLLSQPITVVNVGGHFSVGLRQAMEAEPDGYTFTIAHVALMSGEATSAMNFGYRDFDPVASTVSQCQTVSVRADAPYEDLKSLLDAAKAKPNSILIGANLGALNHMAGVVLENSAPGAKFRFVQIGGGAANVSAMSGGQIVGSMIAPGELLQYSETGIRGLALMAPERQAELPNLPTTEELGYDAQFCFQFWWFAPKGTPAEAIEGFANALEKAIQTHSIRSEIKRNANQPTFTKGEDFDQLLSDTWTQIEPVAKQAINK